MDIPTNQWRTIFGCFVQRSQLFAHSSLLEGPTCSLKVVLLIVILLIIRGFERNPGPPKRGVRLLATSSPARDQSPLAEYQSEKLDRILQNLEAPANDNKRIESKFDAFLLTMNTRLNGLKTEIDAREIKIDKKKARTWECDSLLVQNYLKAVTDDMSTFTCKLDSIKNQVVLLGATRAPNTSSSTPAQQPQK